MNAEHLEGRSSPLGRLGPLGLISTFWGLAVLLILGGYSVVQAVNQAPAEIASTGVQSASVEPPARTNAFASFVPASSYPAIEREPPVLNLACGADDVRTGGGGAGRYSITMRFDQVPDDIRALLAGTDTVFPKDARINMSPCIRGMIERGELP